MIQTTYYFKTVKEGKNYFDKRRADIKDIRQTRDGIEFTVTPYKEQAEYSWRDELLKAQLDR